MMRRFGRRLVTLATTVLALSPLTAAAQDSQPRLTAAAAGGLATPFHGDFDFTARSWELSLRGQTAAHLAIEVFFEQWQHTDREVFLNRDIQGPNGFLGRVGRIEQSTRYTMRTAGVNGLATGRAGRVTFAGGGGIGLLDYDRRFAQATTGCEPSVAHLCNATGNTFTSNGVTAQGVAEVDVAVAPRIQAFGRYLLIVPTSDPGFGHAAVLAGVRLTIW
jgi:hypothetical protein